LVPGGPAGIGVVFQRSVNFPVSLGEITMVGGVFASVGLTAGWTGAGSGADAEDSGACGRLDKRKAARASPMTTAKTAFIPRS
jgi:hypothetical protein